MYRQLGLILGQLQAGDESGMTARVRANLRAIANLSTRPDGWAGHGRQVEEYIREGKTEADPPTPGKSGLGGLDPAMLSAEHRRVLFPTRK